MFADSPRPETAPDVFLSYSSADAEVVREVCLLLETRGLTTFLDRTDLRPGLPWPEKLEGGLSRAGAVAVFLGPSGLGGWQRKEMYFALDRQVAEEKAGREFPVIPVLLPETDPALGFVSLNTWVDLRDPRSPEALDALVRAVRGEAPALSTEAAEVVCPYRGLRSFRAEDAPFFCGREVFSRRLFEAVSAQPFVAVVGASGSGKSSVVAAGLLPLLYRQRPPAATWDVIVFRPRRQPFYELASALLRFAEPDLRFDRLDADARPLADRLASGAARLEDLVDRMLADTGGTDRLLLVIDQLEELFTLAPTEERRPFLEALLGASGRALTVVVTLRSDFYGQVLETSRELSDRLASGGLINLGPMTEEEVRRAIEEPARRVGLRFQDGLVDRILRDVAAEPGRLPLLEFALTELFETRHGREMTHAGYESFGEVEGAIGRRAETEFDHLTAEEQAAAKRLFVTHLVRVSPPEEGANDTRQPARLGDLDEASRRVVEKLSQERVRLLVTGRDEATGEEIVELAHEALLRQWPALAKWMDEDREFLLWRRRLEVRLAEWERSGPADTVLLLGPPLAEAERWLSERAEDLSSRQRRFVEASLAAERLQERRRQERFYAAVGLAVASLVLAGLAFWAWQEAQAGERRIWAASVVANAKVVEGSDPVVAALLLTELGKSIDFSEISEIPGALPLAARLARQPLPQRILQGHVAAFSPDDSRIVTASRDGTTWVWRADGTGRPVILEGNDEPAWSAAVSPDNQRLVIASNDGTVRICNADGTGDCRILGGHTGAVMSAALSPDGRRLATASEDRTVRVWNADGTGEPILLEGHQSLVRSASFSADGRRIVTASSDYTARVWSADGSGEPVVLHHEGGPVSSATFSPDGRRIVTVLENGSARVWNADGTGEPLVLATHDKAVVSAAFGPDGERIVTVSRNGTVGFWGSDSIVREHLTLVGHKGKIASAAFSRDGLRLAAASQDGTVYVWSTGGNGNPVVLTGHRESVWSAGFSPDGRRLVTASFDGTSRVWSLDGRDGPVLAHDGPVVNAAFSRDGNRVLTTSWDGTARAWKADGTGDPVVFEGEEALASAAYAPAGQGVSLESRYGTTRVWTPDSIEAPVLLQGHEEPVRSAAFSPDGQMIVTVSVWGEVRVWNANGFDEPIILEGHRRPVRSAAFSPDGQYVVTASEDRTARVWRVGWEALSEHLRNATTICLTPTQRERYLIENPQEAEERYQECERSHGRPAR